MATNVRYIGIDRAELQADPDVRVRYPGLDEVNRPASGGNTNLTQTEIEAAITDDPAFRTSIGAAALADAGDLYVNILIGKSAVVAFTGTLPVAYSRGFTYTYMGTTYYRFLTTTNSEVMTTDITDADVDMRIRSITRP